MDTQEFATLWDRHKKTFQQQHPQLTDEDLAYTIDQDGELLKRLEKKSGKTEQEIHDWLHIMG